MFSLSGDVRQVFEQIDESSLWSQYLEPLEAWGGASRVSSWAPWSCTSGTLSISIGEVVTPALKWLGSSASFIRSKCGSRTEGWSGSVWKGVSPSPPTGRTPRMGTLPLLQVQSEILQGAKKKKTEDWAPYQWPLPQSHLNLLPLSQGSLSTLHSDSWIESCPGFLGALKFLESSVQHYSVFSSPFPRAFASHNSHGVNPSEFGE